MRATALLLAVATAVTAMPAAAQQASRPGASGYGMPTVTVSAEGHVARAPDIAGITAGVTSEAPAAGDALRTNSKEMSAVVRALKQAGIADRDVQTSGLSLQPQYAYEQNQPPRLTGFRVSNQVHVTLRDVARAGEVIDALVARGANEISGPNFRIEDTESALDAARTEAMKRARARAELYARAAGRSVGRVVQIVEQGAGEPPQPMLRMMRREATDAAAPAPPVAPGEVELKTGVTVTYALD